MCAHLGSCAVNVVYVGVPPRWHKDIACAALATGKDVICEKPLALSAADAFAMAKAASAAEGQSAVNLPFRQMSPVWRMQEAIASGLVGMDATLLRVSQQGVCTP